MNNNSFPDPLASESTKNSNEYALKIFKAIYGSFMEGYNSFYERRNAKILDNRLFASGKQPIQPLLDALDIDGKAAYINMDMTPSAVAPKFKAVVVNKNMAQKESVNCTSLNKTVRSRKDKKRKDAEFQANNSQLVDQLSQQAGYSFKNPDIPDSADKDELDLYFNLNDKEREEVIMAKMINFVMQNNEWEPHIKKQILSDLWDANYAVVRTYYDDNLRICLDNIRPEAYFHSSSYKENMSDISYNGHMLRMTISDFRVMFPDVSEKTIMDIANSCKNMYGNTAMTYVWLDNYYTGYQRPYDNTMIELMYVWYKTSKTINYVVGKDGFGRKVVDLVSEKGNLTNPNKEYKQKVIDTAYTGYWAIGTEQVFNWGEERNQMRNPNALEKVINPYSVIMMNNDGTMEMRSPQDMIKSSIRSMDECNFRIRQIVAKAAPDGFRIDIQGLVNVDLGGGIGELGPLELVSIYHQTGNMYWNSKNEAGELEQAPIEPIQTSFGGKLTELINLYNFYLNQIRDFLGINEATEGQSLPARTGLGVLQGQIGQSNNAIRHIYDSYANIMKGTANCVAHMLWDSILDGNMLDDYRDILGEDDYEFLNKNKEMLREGFDVEMNIGSTDAEKAELNEAINLAIQQGTLGVEDKIYITEINDFKLAMQYLALKKRKNQEEASKAKQADIQANTQLQQAVAQETSQAAMQLEQMKAQTELAVTEMKTKAEIESKERSMLADLLKTKATTGVPFDPLTEKLLNNLLTKYNLLTVEDIDNEAKRMKLEEQHEAMEQQAQQEQAQQQQEQGLAQQAMGGGDQEQGEQQDPQMEQQMAQ